MAGDVDYPSVGLLLNLNGTNGSTTVTDSSISPKTATVAGNAQISTAQSKYGGASLLLDGAGDYVSFASHADWNFGTGDFTVEAWVRTSAPSTLMSIVTRQDGTSNGVLQLRTNSGAFEIVLRDNNGTGLVVLAGGTVGTNTWQHVAASRSGSTLRLFVNGTQVNSTTSSVNLTYTNARALVVGGLDNGSGPSQYWTGYIDDVRVTKGVARYTASFTAPAAELPNWAGQVTGVVRDSAGAFAARTVRAHRRDTGALVASTTSDAGTGAYTLNCPTLDEVYRIIMDSASSGTIYNDLIDRVIPA